MAGRKTLSAGVVREASGVRRVAPGAPRGESASTRGPLDAAVSAAARFVVVENAITQSPMPWLPLSPVRSMARIHPPAMTPTLLLSTPLHVASPTHATPIHPR